MLVRRLLLSRGAALVSPEVADQECTGLLFRDRGRGRACQKWSLGGVDRHKKRGKSGRYFDRDRAVYAGRGQGSVRSASGSNDLSEFRTALDTGLCCDYFKAQYAGDRICRHWLLSPSKTD